MPFNGGTPNVFQRVYSWATDKQNAIPVTASRVDTEDDGFATGLSLALLRDGSQQVSANMPWNGYHISGYGSTSAASARTDVPAFGQVQDGAANYAVAGGSADGLTLTVSPAITAYAAGQVFWARLTATNVTTAPTLSVSGLAAKTIVKTAGGALAAGDLVSGDIVGFAYQSALDKFMPIVPAGDVGASTGTGSLVRATSPTLVTPVLGAATATSITLANEAWATYDEGTVTVTATCGTSGTVTLTGGGGENTVTYIQNGKGMTTTGRITAGSVSSPVGTLTINGLPGTTLNNPRNYPAVAVVPEAWAAGLVTGVSGRISGTAASLNVYMGAATGGSTQTNVANNVQANASLMIGVTYLLN